MLGEVLVPSKTFLLGEYSVLEGGPALVLAHGPYFEFDPKSVTSFHPNSPAGRFSEDFKLKSFGFKDPYLGAGGFGGSTAELILANKSSQTFKATKPLLQYYYGLPEHLEKPPSGADLACQNEFLGKKAGLLFFQKKPLDFKKINWPFKGLDFLIYKTNRKVKTFEHLKGLKDKSFLDLKAISNSAVEALNKKNQEGFLKLLKDFTAVQLSCGLLADETKAFLGKLNNVPNLAAARGCGALGADVICLLVRQAYVDKVKEDVVSSLPELSFVQHIGSLDFEL